MVKRTFTEIIEKMKSLGIKNEYDLMVLIGNGGIIPGLLLNQFLMIPFEIIWINFRENKTNKIIKNKPELLEEINFKYEGKKLLLVDDVSNSGQTINLAKTLLKNAKKIDTFVVNGNADYQLYNEPCFKFPWNI